MRKLLTLAVIVLFLFGMVPASNLIGKKVAIAAGSNKTAVHTVARFHQVGYDWDDTPLIPARDFPWQKVGQVCWGRTNFYMPDIVKAMTSAGLPIPVTVATQSPVPAYYTQVYLNVKAEAGISQESNAYYVVVDSIGQMWFDPDGFYNDSRYDPTADPIPARWPFESFPMSPTYIPGACSTNLQAKVDPGTDNNTKGPFILNKFSPSFNANTYFWDYKKDEKSNASDRQWRIGWVDMVDFPFAGSRKPDGSIETGVVSFNTATLMGDWDYNMPLVPFYQVDPINNTTQYYQEFHTELVPDKVYTPGNMGVNGVGERPPEAIYRIKTPLLSNTITAVGIGDLRMTAVSKVSKTNPDDSRMYPEGTYVLASDWDFGDVLHPFRITEKHVDNSILNKQYDANEWIYRIADASLLTVPNGAIRLTNVNTKKRVTGTGIAQNISLDMGIGMSAGDALFMMEMMQGGCHTQKYDISVLTDLYMGDYPSSTAAGLRSSNGDIALASQRVQKNTVLDPALDKDTHHLLPGTTFHNVQFGYREYTGVQVFLDNGVDNNIGANRSNDFLASQDLNANGKEEHTGEQYIGAKDYISTLDLGRKLSLIPDNYRFHNTNVEPPTDLRPKYGCGEAIYYITDINRGWNAAHNIFDPLLSVVKPGDRRFTDIDIVIGNVRIKYNRNTIVADGDSDANLSLSDFYYMDPAMIRRNPYKFYQPDYNAITPEYSLPFDYDPNLTAVYQDTNENYIVDVTDVRLSDVLIEDTAYSCGSPVTGGNNWFMEAPVNMISIGKNGDYSFVDSEILPGDIGLKVVVDGKEELMDPETNHGLHSQHVKVEQTSTITVSVDPPPKKGEKVYVTIHEPESNEFNIFRNQEWLFSRSYESADYNTQGQPMNWFGDGSARAGIWEYELPFEFPYMGQFYNRVYVAEKGFLNFTTKYGMPESISAPDARIMVYGDDLSIYPPTHNMNITTRPGFATNPWTGLPLRNTDPENIYILKTPDSVMFRWRAQTRYNTVNSATPVLPGYATRTGSYQPRITDGNIYALIDVQCTLFRDGTVIMNFLKDTPPLTGVFFIDQLNKQNNMVNNVNRNTWVIGAPVIGITTGTSGSNSRYSGLKNLAAVDGVYTGTWIVTPRLDFYSSETWRINMTEFNKPTTQRGNVPSGSFAAAGSAYDDYNQWKPYEDFRILTEENPTATFEYTPYRGTSRESGIPDWVEIKAFKEYGGTNVAPKDSTYTYIPQYNYSDPTVWNSMWTRPQYMKSPWGIFQKTKYFVYPPTEKLVPNEYRNNYDCFGIARLQVDPEKINLIPDKASISPLDERQPAVILTLKNADNKDDVNDPEGMVVSSWRTTVDYANTNVQMDFALTDNWLPPTATSPVGAYFLRIGANFWKPGMFKVGDIVYIPPSSQPAAFATQERDAVPNNAQPEYRRIVRIDNANRRIWFDLPLINSHPPNTQVVPNPIIGNYNIKGGGIHHMFTTIGGAGQRYIVQVRDDGSYDYWRWYEPLVIGQVVGALDAHDILYSWQCCSSYNRNTSQEGCNYPLQRATFPLPNARPPIGLEDMDCSLGQSMNAICGDTTEFPDLGDWSMKDRYGVFGNNAENHWNYPLNGGNPAYPYGAINTYGVPVLVMPYRTPVNSEQLYDDGGKCLIAAWPQDPATPMNIRLYLNTAIFDYNSVYKHPPYFALDTGMGIDYCGEVSIKVCTPNAEVNFTDFAIIDHALQNSKVDYTLGNAAISKLPPPSAQIASRYYPMLKEFNRDLRAYPGGQSNTGRVVCNLSINDNAPGSNWNAYPAIWENQFVKLGTEFMPMTDYGMAFYIKTNSPFDHYSFYAGGARQVTRMEIQGPFAFPKAFMEDQTRGSGLTADQYFYKLNQRYEYNEYKNVPLDYDFSGKLVIDSITAFRYESQGGETSFYPNNYLNTNNMTGSHDFKRVTNPGAPFDAITIPDNEINPWLYFGEKWFYWGVGRYNLYPNVCVGAFRQDYWMFNPVFLIDELIPTGAGKITIKVFFADGSTAMYNNCCEEPPAESIPVHGILIEGAPKTLEIETDNSLELTLTEAAIPAQDTEYCNNAFLIAWQDRGYIEKSTGKLVGMGDGQLANPPRSSIWYKVGKQYHEGYDLNSDGKISFDNFETEVIGAYDMATNTWSSGVVDGRTFMREDGAYKFDFTANNKNQIVTMGYDFGGIPDQSGTFDKKPDHVISQYELIPIYINAYKYADDNNDRGFTPLWKPFAPMEYSHEVYLGGMVKMMPTPHEDLVLSYGPDPLTAGVTPEIVNAEKPLTINVLDDQGNPVNLAVGVPDKNNQKTIIPRNVWNLLILDPHPDNKDFFGQDAKLPQYYWLRTDLHNNDSTVYDNNSIYFSTMTPFDPISIDFSKSQEGIYKFYNFCANDAGSFEVVVFTPDRRHFGRTTVSVKLPSISYKIRNLEDTDKVEYEVPGSPDFVMTAMDKRIYEMSVAVQDAQGEPLKGVTGAQMCEGTTDARITVTNTFLRNFRYPALSAPRYYNLLGLDKDKDGKIEPTNRERINLDGFRGSNLYNTMNAIDQDGRFYTTIATDIPQENSYFNAWGLGCIYNSPYKGGYCFPDIDKDQVLTFNDSISLDQDGKASFLFYANDMGLTESFVGTFIGKNRLTSNPSWNDVAGIPSFDMYGPYNVWTRFRTGGQRFFQSSWSMFRIDWDAHPDVFTSIKGPDFRFLEGETRQPIGKDLLDPNNYDLMFGVENYFIVQSFQADSRDLPLKEGGVVTFMGGRAEKSVEGKMMFGVDSVPETSIKMTPAGTGRSMGYVQYVVMKGGYSEQSDIDVGLSDYARFDVTNGIGIEVTPLGDLYPKKKATLHIKVVDAASRKPIESATVRVVGSGINEKSKTNNDGICEVDITPSEEGLLRITAEKETMIKGTTTLYIGKDKRPIFLQMDPIPEVTNQKILHIAGLTKVNAIVSINDQKVTADNKGSFRYDFTLQEGKNEIRIKADFEEDSKAETRTVYLDTVPPATEYSELGTLVNVKEITLRGTLTEQGSVTCNGINALMIGNDWQLNLPVSYGKNMVAIVVKDIAGNTASFTREVYIYQKKLVEVQIGSKSVFVDGAPQKDLSVAPYIKNGRTMLPIRVIVESLGATVEYLARTKEVIVTMDQKVIKMKIGSRTAFMDQKEYMIDAAPEAIQGVTFVPLRFITEAFGLEIEWIEATRTARVIKLI